MHFYRLNLLSVLQYGCTALHIATFQKRLSIAYVLLEAGADTKLKTKVRSAITAIGLINCMKLNLHACFSRKEIPL